MTKQHTIQLMYTTHVGHYGSHFHQTNIQSDNFKMGNIEVLSPYHITYSFHNQRVTEYSIFS